MAANKQYKNDSPENMANEPDAIYTPSSSKVKGFVTESEDERLLKDADAPPIEKLMSFTRMIRRNATLKKLQ